MTKAEGFHFEVAFFRDGVVVYGYDAEKAPMDLRKVKGKVRIEFRDSKREPLEAPMACIAVETLPGDEKKRKHDRSKDENADAKRRAGKGILSANVDLSRVHEGQVDATFSLVGLSGKTEKETTFRAAFRLARLTNYVCPMKCTEPLADPGDCPKCGMSLKQHRYIYACPMHPKVTSNKEGASCWECGMALVETASPVGGTKKGEEGEKGHKGQGG